MLPWPPPIRADPAGKRLFGGTLSRLLQVDPKSLTLYPSTPSERCTLAKPNYAFAKRQRDLAKKQRKEEKQKRKAGQTEPPVGESVPRPPAGEKPLP